MNTQSQVWQRCTRCATRWVVFAVLVLLFVFATFNCNEELLLLLLLLHSQSFNLLASKYFDVVVVVVVVVCTLASTRESRLFAHILKNWNCIQPSFPFFLFIWRAAVKNFTDTNTKSINSLYLNTMTTVALVLTFAFALCLLFIYLFVFWPKNVLNEHAQQQHCSAAQLTPG